MQTRPAVAEKSVLMPRPTRDELQRRVRAEYLEMPGLSLSLQQARRLFGVPNTEMCRMVLDTLVDQRFLVRAQHGCYRRRSVA